ncbi:MAG: efflux RND transporter periplasmic adaptor subunit [Pyrinomonadaceae bacterium]|nr:efflux RND transporter periplasmic adaptor subunit [Pyrinomonadaceae bacterium]
MKRTIILSAIASVLIAFSLGYFLWFSPAQVEQKVSAEKEKTEQKTTAKSVVAAPGVVEAISEEIEVGTEIAGKLRSVLVEEGDEVVKGQTIAVLENSDFEAQIRTARANIETLQSGRETARARVGQAAAERQRIANGARTEERREARADFEQTLPNVENARRELERRRKLHQTGDVSREELERAANAFENAQKQSQTVKEKYNVVNAEARMDDLARADAAIHLAEANTREFDASISEAETRVRTAEANLAKTIVRAPISGIVLRKRLKDGESVSPENPTGIVTIADTSKLRVRVDLDETDVAKVRENQTAYVTADAFGEQKFAARVVKIGRILGRKNFRTERPTEKVDTKILEVLLELEPNQKLPLGLRVDAFISTGD